MSTKKKDKCCKIDNHAVSFAIDKVNKRVVLTLKDGTKFHLTAADLRDLIGAAADTKLERLYINPARHIVGVLSDGTEVVSAGTIPLGGGGTDDYVNSAEIMFDSDFKYIVLTRKSGETVGIDLWPVYNGIMGTVYEKLDGLRQQIAAIASDKPYRFITAGDSYNLNPSHVDSKTIIKLDSDDGTDVVLNTDLEDEHIGRAIIFTKTAGEGVGKESVLHTAGATVIPDDVFPLRRIGSSAVLVYMGNHEWLAYGELP